MPKTVSQRVYAKSRRDRDLPGGSHQAVGKALNDGRISLAKDGKIDPDQADRDWKANTDPLRRNTAGDDLQRARAAKAAVDARRAQLQLELEEGKLVRLDEVERRWFSLARRMRDKMMSLPNRVSGELIHESDITAFETRLSDEIRAAFHEIEKEHTNGNGSG